jgi:hypothetical protein
MGVSKRCNHSPYTMLKTTIFAAATICLASVASATNITCRYGAMSNAPDADRSCGTRDMGTTPYQDQVCDDRTHSCLTAAYAGDWFAAYGCFPNNVIPVTKAFIQVACAEDATCSQYNSGGIPANGWQECNTDECNSCNSASVSGPSAVVLLLGASVAAASLF